MLYPVHRCRLLSRALSHVLKMALCLCLCFFTSCLNRRDHHATTPSEAPTENPNPAPTVASASSFIAAFGVGKAMRSDSYDVVLSLSPDLSPVAAGSVSGDFEIFRPVWENLIWSEN